MAQVKNSDELLFRLQQATGEEILAFGKGNLGMKNVYVALTPSALFLEFVSFSGTTKESERIPLENLEFIYAISGDASTPKLLKLNASARILDRITTTLLYKEKMGIGKLNYIRFSKLPYFKSNDQVAHEIVKCLVVSKPELVKEPDFKAIRKSKGKSHLLVSFSILFFVFALILSIVFIIALGEGWSTGIIVGSSVGFIFSAIFAPMIPVFKRMLTGQE